MGRGARTLILSLAALGCADELDPGAPIDVSRPECENLDPGTCLAPWPSSRFLVDDPATTTGRRVAIAPEAMLHNRDGLGIDPGPYERFDGFSVNTALVVALPGPLDTSSLAGEDGAERSVQDDSPTVIVDAVTGERVAHWAEVDAWTGSDPDRVTLYMRPLRPLAENHRYLAAVRSLTLQDGDPIEPSPYFRALRDGTPTEVDELEARRDAMRDVFDRLTDAGVARESLVVAWELHTGTRDSVRADMLQMREDALMRIGDRGTACTVTAVREDPADAVYRRVEGTFEVPLYLESEEHGTRLVRSAGGTPVFQRMGTARFVAMIPASVRDAAGPAPVLTFGHGLLGEAPDVALLDGEEGVRVRTRLGPLIDRLGMVAVATDWWGLSLSDGPVITTQLGELSRFPEVPERLMQAMVNFLTLTRSFSGGCAELTELHVGGRPAIDPSRRRYLGISGGGVLGFTLAALSPDIDAFALVVGGASWPTLISRSFAFFPFNLVLNGAYLDKRERDVMLVATALLWDQVDPISFAPMVLLDPPSGVPVRRVLLPAGRHDALVANVASDQGARAMGLPLLVPSGYRPYDMPTAEAPVDSAYVMYDLGAAPQPAGAAQPEDNGVHDGVVRVGALQDQIVAFLSDSGRVEQTCDGICDPD